MDFETKSKVYIKTDDRGRILRCEGGYTTPVDLVGWQEIDEGTGDRYKLCQSHYFDALYTEQGVPRYKYEGGACVLRSDEELAADRDALPKPQPSQLDRVEAQATYTAMMTDTLMEG